MADLVIIGGGGHGVSVFEAISSVGQFNVIGFTDNHAKAVLSRFGVEYLGVDADLYKIMSSETSAVIGIGQIESAEPRMAIGKMLVKKNNLNVNFLTRVEDEFCWKFSNKGYFNFKSNIPIILTNFKLN